MYYTLSKFAFFSSRVFVCYVLFSDKHRLLANTAGVRNL